MDALTMGLVLALLAGLATTVGSAIVFFLKKPKIAYLAFSIAFSTGVMITISFVELLPKAMEAIGHVNTLAFFIVGAGFIFLIDSLVPHKYVVETASNSKRSDPTLRKTCLLVALGFAIHNFPEGLAVLAASLQSLEFGVTMAIAIAMHNIPEGISVSMPIYYSTRKKTKAFFISFLSGATEPIGAIIGALVLLPFLSPQLIACALAFVAGVMVYVCIDELIPTAFRYCKGNHQTMTFGFLLGSIVMSATFGILA